MQMPQQHAPTHVYAAGGFAARKGLGGSTMLRYQKRAVGFSALACLLMFSACGSRLSEQTIRTDAGFGSASAASGGPPGAGGAGTTAPVAAGSNTRSLGGSSRAQNSVSRTTGSSGSARVGPGSSPVSPSNAPGSYSGGPVSSAPGSVISLGNVGTYSGVVGATFEGAQQTIEAWAAYTNAHGGLSGHPVKVITADDGGDPSTSQSLVEQMVSQDHVIAFVGDNTVSTDGASLPYLEKQHIPVIGGAMTSFSWWTSSVMFPQGTYTNALLDGAVRMGPPRGKTQFGLLYCVESPNCSAVNDYLFKEGHARADGVNPVYSGSFSITQPSFTAQCLDARQAGVNFLYALADTNSLERLARDCAAQGYHPTYAITGQSLSASMADDSNFNGMAVAEPYFPWFDTATPSQQAYQAAMQTYAPGVVRNMASAEMWAAGELVTAADQYLGADPTSAQFFEGLWSLRESTVGGLTPPLTFNTNSTASKAACYFQIVDINGRLVDPNNGRPVC